MYIFCLAAAMTPTHTKSPVTAAVIARSIEINVFDIRCLTLKVRYSGTPGVRGQSSYLPQHRKRKKANKPSTVG